jgi:hypothetical protein
VMMQAIRPVLAKRIYLSDKMSALSSSTSLPSAPKLQDHDRVALACLALGQDAGCALMEEELLAPMHIGDFLSCECGRDPIARAGR